MRYSRFKGIDLTSIVTKHLRLYENEVMSHLVPSTKVVTTEIGTSVKSCVLPTSQDSHELVRQQQQDGRKLFPSSSAPAHVNPLCREHWIPPRQPQFSPSYRFPLLVPMCFQAGHHLSHRPSPQAPPQPPAEGEGGGDSSSANKTSPASPDTH